ncbi:MAG: hypothetical protein HY525_06365 [Betaproteobacteria bacterium]|nr:hypothetical protein [Betaproteobacteria bacterium]
MKPLVGTTALLACLLPAIAAAQTRQVNIFAFEDASCSAWAKSADNKLLRAHYVSWIQGFVSGHNYASPARQVKTGSLPGSEALYEFLDAYCKDNPSLSFIGAAITLVEDLRESSAPAKKARRPAPAKKEPAKAAPAKNAADAK